ncbi:MAG TPA: hypothetical protein VFO65_11655, partial [Acidimicrobiales bacterium]|nr:hypothetical protein [Acidimicrobiales bacterium]
GPGFFRFADDAEFARLLEGAGLEDVSVRTESFAQVVAGAEELWSGVVEGTVRTRAVILAQPPEVQARIRAAFDRLVAQYDSGPGRGLRLPVSVKVASARKPPA